MANRILALDIATRMGVAFGSPGEEPTYYSKRLGGTGLGPSSRGAELKRWLVPFFRDYQPTHIYIEQPVQMQGRNNKTNAAALMVPNYLAHSAMEGAELLGIPSNKRVFVHVQSVRKFFVGQGRPADKKAAVIRRCTELGWSPQDDNAADALAIWAFACAQIDPEAAFALAALAPAERPKRRPKPTTADEEYTIPDFD